MIQPSGVSAPSCSLTVTRIADAPGTYRLKEILSMVWTEVFEKSILGSVGSVTTKLYSACVVSRPSAQSST